MNNKKLNRTERAARSEVLEAMAAKIAESAAQLKQLQDCSPEEARAMRLERGNPFAPAACEGVEVIASAIPLANHSVPVRRYYPEGYVGEELPALVYYHGGGYVLGDVAQYDTLTQQIAHLANCIVVSVDYRLSPEVKSAQIFEEAFEVYRWLRMNGGEWGIDTNRIAVGGDSAGGNLSVAVCLSCKEDGYRQPDFQLLLYPAADYSLSFPSMDEFAEGYFLTKAGIVWFQEHFLEDASRTLDPKVSPLFADLDGLAPAFVLTAGFDPLRDEGEALADKLAVAGVPVRHVCYTDMIHAFISFAGGIEAGMEALEESATELKRAFGTL